MGQTILVEETNCIPADATVYHYDELDENAKHCFPHLLDDESWTTGLPPAVRHELAACDYVKFTSYYRIRAE
ncbi:hypothetical protein [Halococcus sediminicola]|uniref:hypothetical protein n=1 Tax=Halococcus sediminicola TaxID=1264579 RepID=UPI000679A8E4|nr:hypothetical protein [Halococcus sediminicola]